MILLYTNMLLGNNRRGTIYPFNVMTTSKDYMVIKYADLMVYKWHGILNLAEQRKNENIY